MQSVKEVLLGSFADCIWINSTNFSTVILTLKISIVSHT